MIELRVGAGVGMFGAGRFGVGRVGSGKVEAGKVGVWMKEKYLLVCMLFGFEGKRGAQV